MSRFSPPLQATAGPRVAAPNWMPPVASLLEDKGRIGLFAMLLGAYALMCTVPVAELLVTHVGIHIPVVVIAQVALTLGLFAGRIGEFWKLPVAKPYMIFLVLCGVAALFGTYPTRSLELIIPYGLRFHVLPFYFCAIALTTKQVRHALGWLGWGAFLLLVLCFVYGRMSEDRFVIPDTTLANPNDLGFAILFVMSGLLVLQSKVARVLVALSLPVFLIYLLKTGSRADMITLMALMVVAFYFAPRNWKVIMLVAMPVIAGGVLAVVPSQTLARLTTIVSNPLSTRGATTELNQALDSQAARLELQQRAISLTIRHPLLGVGVTNFEDAVDEMVEETLHVKSGWQVAHNTYLQTAAENGVPAFCLYVWTLILCLKMNFWSYRTCRETPLLSESVTQSFALILMNLMFVVCIAFSNNSCDPHLGVLVGLTAANYLAIKRELQGSKIEPVHSPAFAPARMNQGAMPGPRVPVRRPVPVVAQLPFPVRRRGPA